MKKLCKIADCHCFALCTSFIGRFLAGAVSRRTFRFTVVGALATFSYFLLGILFVNIMGMHALTGNTLAYILSFAVSYLGQCLWTFQSSGDHKKTLPRFAIAQFIGFLINSCIIGFCMRLGLIYMFSMFVAIAVVPVITYLICKFWVFHQKNA